MSGSATWDRIGAVSGILFAVLVVVSIQVSMGTGITSVPADVAGVVAIDYNQRQGDLRFGAYLMTAAVFFLFWFLAMLRYRLEQAQGESGWLPSVAYGAGLTGGGVLLMLASLGFAGSFVGDFEGDWAVAKTILILSWDHLIVLLPALAALVAATSIVSIRSGALPAWLGWISLTLVLAPILVAPALMTIAFLVWVIVVSLVLLYQSFTEESGYLG
ncbi:MAG: hypothetical protein O3B65_04030 [Chloroflexi bacterium]|nr:hypothetical protein [Chloroflexota bacterium]